MFLTTRFSTLKFNLFFFIINEPPLFIASTMYFRFESTLTNIEFFITFFELESVTQMCRLGHPQGDLFKQK